MIKTQQEHLQIADTILQQLGGKRKLNALIGLEFPIALDISANYGGLQFSFKGSRKVNKCVIKLNGLDLYDFELWKISPTFKHEPELVYSIDDIYADMLKSIFENETQLYLSL